MANTQEVTKSETRRLQLIHHGMTFRSFTGLQKVTGVVGERVPRSTVKGRKRNVRIYM